MERSAWTLSVMTASILLLASGLLVPWYSFHHSTGKQTPPGEPEDQGSGAEERHVYYHPFDIRGDASSDQQAAAQRPTLILGLLASSAVFFAALNLLLELFGGMREATRRTQMVLSVIGFLVVATTLVYVWFAFPALLADEGVTQPFTTRNDQGTFVRSTLSWGWTLAALSLISHAATFAFKFAGGVFSLAFLDQYRSDSR